MISRFGSYKAGIKKTGTESDSGGWKDSDDDEELVGVTDRGEKRLAGSNPGVNDYVVVTPPVEDKGKVPPAGRFLTSSISSSSRTEQGPAEEHSLKREYLHEQRSSESSTANSTSTPYFIAKEEEEIVMPGSYDMLKPRDKEVADETGEEEEKVEVKQRSWVDLFKALGLR